MSNSENKFEKLTGDIETIDANKKLRSVYVNKTNLIIAAIMLIIGAGIIIGFSFLGKNMAEGEIPIWFVICIMLVFSCPGWSIAGGGIILTINSVKAINQQNKVLNNSPTFTKGLVYRLDDSSSKKRNNYAYLSYIDYIGIEHTEKIDGLPFFFRYTGEDIPVMVAYTENNFIILAD